MVYNYFEFYDEKKYFEQDYVQDSAENLESVNLSYPQDFIRS